RVHSRLWACHHRRYRRRTDHRNRAGSPAHQMERPRLQRRQYRRTDRLGDGVFPRARPACDPELPAMTRPQKTIIAVLSVIAVSLVVIIGINAAQTYRAFASQPLGPVLPAQTLPPTWTASPAPSPVGQVTLAPTISFATNTPAAKCGGPNVMNILVIGADTRGDNYTYGLADAIRILRVDFVTPKVTVLEFPRDLWVEIPHIADNLNGQDHEKINQAFLYGQPGFKYWDDPREGSGLLALTLNKNFGVQIDHYITVNMRTFVNIVNAVGGIDVNIPDKETSRTADLPVGENHLSGAEALKLVRNREGGTFERADNQSLVICA